MKMDDYKDHLIRTGKQLGRLKEEDRAVAYAIMELNQPNDLQEALVMLSEMSISLAASLTALQAFSEKYCPDSEATHRGQKMLDGLRERARKNG